MSLTHAPQNPPAVPLGSVEQRLWPPDPGGYGGRKARRGGRYEVFIPDQIAQRDFILDGEAVAGIAEAAKALHHLQASPPRLATLGALAQNLLRSESVASSRIEGIHLSHQRLARASYQAGRRRPDRAAEEVLGNVEAMKQAIQAGSAGALLTLTGIEETHRTLLRYTTHIEIAGVTRASQNWIGGNDFNPVGAIYVPPPHKHVRPLLGDLCAFVNRDDIAPVAQAAIAHAQFETIHPFADGNGRVGRALIYTVLGRRDEITNYIPPVSLILAAEPKAYIAGLTAYRHGNVSRWTTQFADAIERAARASERLADAIEQRQSAWLDELGHPRRDAAVRQLVSALPEQPVIDVATAQRLTGKSHVAVGRAIQQLEDAGILNRRNERKWGRVWECDQLLSLVETFERSLRTARR